VKVIGFNGPDDILQLQLVLFVCLKIVVEDIRYMEIFVLDSICGEQPDVIHFIRRYLLHDFKEHHPVPVLTAVIPALEEPFLLWESALHDIVFLGAKVDIFDGHINPIGMEAGDIV
jgi:hypothetical protein